MTGPRFATCDYQRFHPAMGVPVQTSLGAPKMPLLYRPVPLREVMPDRSMLGLDYDEYRRKYRHKLHRTTLTRVMAGVNRVRGEARAEPDATIVLLCFENLGVNEHKGSLQWCHRSFLAQWLQEKTGEDVPEYGDLLLACPVPGRCAA